MRLDNIMATDKVSVGVTQSFVSQLRPRLMWVQVDVFRCVRGTQDSAVLHVWVRTQGNGDDSYSQASKCAMPTSPGLGSGHMASHCTETG